MKNRTRLFFSFFICLSFLLIRNVFAQIVLTPFKIANNLELDIAGNYPKGYEPKWQYLSTMDRLDFVLEQFVNKYSPATKKDTKNIFIGYYDGKAVVRFTQFVTCDCIADLDIKSGIARISTQQQTFRLVNFRKYMNGKASGEPCISSSNFYTQGGWKGYITLSGSPNGDLLMNLEFESYNGTDRFTLGGMSFRWTAQNISIPNLMTPEKAKATIIAKENQRKESEARQIEYAREERKRDSLFEIEIKDSYAKVVKKQSTFPKEENAGNCLRIEKGSKYIPGTPSSSEMLPEYRTNPDGSMGETHYIEVTHTGKPGYYESYEGFKNTCNHTVSIKGIEKLRSKAGTIYFKDASFQIPAGEITNSIVLIENDYKANSAEIGSTHYYRDNLK